METRSCFMVSVLLLSKILVMQISLPKELKQPENGEYLWRYIKPGRIGDFLNGEVYFSTLRQFEDYYEGITPTHIFLLNYLRETCYVNQNLVYDRNPIQLALETMKMRLSEQILLRQLQLVTGIANKEKILFFVEECFEKFQEIEQEHLRLQAKIHCSCWFVGNEEESAAMWKAYSQEGGIAVRIRADRFMSKISNHVEAVNRFNPDTGIDTIHLGKVEYHHYQLSEKWMTRVQNGVPLAFFKHKSFEHESEFRMIYEVENGQASSQIPLFPLLNDFTITLHPSTPVGEFPEVSKKYSDRGARVLLSQMWWPGKQ